MKLYKYTKLEYALDIVENGRLYLSRPEEFNDPFDCVLSTDKKSRRETARLISNYTLFEETYNFAINNINHIMTNKEEALEIIEHGKTLKTTLTLYPRYSYWNTTSKFVKDYKALHYKEFDEQFDIHQRAINNEMESIRHETLIYCFTQNNNSLLMWSHYGDAHKGVCVEFEIEPIEKDLIDVKYTDKKVNFDIYTVTSIILALEFIRKPFKGEDKEFNNIIMEPFYTKSNEWAYEKEYRYIFSTKSKERVYYDNGHYYIKTPKIKSVSFGCRVDVNNPICRKIIDICSKKGISIKYLETSEELYSLEEKEL